MSEIKNIPSFLNMELYPLGDYCNVREDANVNSTIYKTVKKGNGIGRATGNLLFTDQDGENYWFQVSMAGSMETLDYAYVRTDVCTFISGIENENPLINAGITLYTGINGNSLLDAVIKNDKVLYKQLLTLGKEIQNGKANNIDISSYETIYNQILADYKTRQTKIAETIGYGVAIQAELSLIPGGQLFVDLYNEFSNYLSGYKRLHGLGAAYLIPIAITAVVTALVIYGLYEVFKPDYERGKVNLKVSSDLQKALSTLSPAEQVAVMKDLQGQIDEAYNAGKKDSSSIMTIVKYVAIIGGTAWGVTELMKLANKYKTKQKSVNS